MTSNVTQLNKVQIKQLAHVPLKKSFFLYEKPISWTWNATKAYSRIYKNTLRLNEVLGKLLGGLAGITSERLNAVLGDVGEEEEADAGCGFIHWSHSCVILDKAVFNLSEEYEMKVLIRRSLTDTLNARDWK